MLEKHRRKRHYPGMGHILDVRKSAIGFVITSDSVVDDLLQFLNEAKRGTEPARIVRIIEEMQELEQAEEPEFSAEDKFVIGSKPDAALRHSAKLKKHQELEKREALLNKEFARYRPYLHLHAIRRGASNPHFSPHWWVQWKIQSPIERKGQISTGLVIHTILNLAGAGYLSRLRRCSNCGRWLYAKSRKQDFCSTKCQQKHYTQSESYKAHRRNYMRRYYQANSAK
jgi:hypothetical protein